MDNAKTIYLDHSATTPLDPRVLTEMTSVLAQNYGNPSSIYKIGQEGAKLIEESREQVASVINSSSREVVFTSGGTESDNLAIKGAAFALKAQGNHIITSSIEHHAVLHTCEWLEKNAGFEVTYLEPNSEGFIEPKQVLDAVTTRTTVVSIMYVNNEIGTIQPISDIANDIRDYSRINKQTIIFHTDAVQAAGWLSLDVESLGVDLMSLSAHKFYGPKGVGILYIRKGTQVAGQMNGGSQENNLRAGTENTAGIVGAGLALYLSEQERPLVVPRISELRDDLFQDILSIESTYVNGSKLDNRIANNVNISIKGVEIESIIINLDMQGIAVSSGSACTVGSIEPSHVLLALGMQRDLASTSLRITLGKNSTKEDILELSNALPQIVKRVRSMNAPRS
jgi:cysteine desulfurase|tara:strand:- start:781 stop:1968 length:1188 start_codon:yes stop_codon:yes gene_type:complete